MRLKSLAEQATHVNERSRREEQLTAALGDGDKFHQQLVEYAKRYPEGRRAADIGHAAEEAPLWEWLGRWNETVRGLGRENLCRFNRAAAGEQAAKLAKLLADYGGHPDAQAFAERLEYLKCIAARRDADGNAIEAALKPLFVDPLIAEAWMLQDTAGRRYYMKHDPTAKWGGLQNVDANRLYSFEYITDFNNSTKRKTLHGAELVPGGFSPRNGNWVPRSAGCWTRSKTRTGSEPSARSCEPSTPPPRSTRCCGISCCGRCWWLPVREAGAWPRRSGGRPRR